MMQTLLTTAPSRLHFGLASFAPRPGRPGYSGLGLMVDTPPVQVRIAPASQLTFGVLHAERLKAAVQQCCEHWQIEPPPLQLSVAAAPPHHAGLGLGTQLAISVARGLARALHRPEPSAQQLHQLTGRGRRSAVGTYGNLHGGLIVDAGKLAATDLGVLETRLDVPREWCFVLALQNNLSGESGDSEEAAFAELPAINDTITKQLRSLAVDEVVPACRAGEFDRFADSIEAYGQLAGSCFAAWQGGVFASPQLALLAQQLKAAGARGVGQSSWGPTLYAMAASRGAAQQVVARVAPHCGATFVLAHANRHGLRYEWLAGSD